MIIEMFLVAVMWAVRLILMPIDALVSSLIPNLAQALSDAATFITYMSQALGWAVSAAGIPYSTVALIATVTIFKLTLPINIWLIKLGVKWWATLKP